MVSEVKQIAGYESVILVLLLVFWASYRYWKSTKPGELAAEMEEEDDVPEAISPVREHPAATPESFLDVESTLYNDKPSAPISVTITGDYGEIPPVVAEENPDFSDFDPRKAVIWSEVLKRPYC
jgi:hypothetical protein